MKKIDINNRIELIKTSESFSLVLTTIKEVLELKKIEVTFTKKVTSVTLFDLKHKVRSIQDEQFTSINELILTSRNIISAFIYFLEKLHNSKIYGINEEYDKLTRLGKYFYSFSQSYDLNNRFRIMTHNPLIAIIDNQTIEVDYNNLNLNEDQEIYLNELFSIRKEIFIELAAITNEFINNIELQKFLNNGLKLTQNGITVIAEIILAMNGDKRYYEVNSSSDSVLAESFCKVFGISKSIVSKKRSNIETRKNGNSELARLAEKLPKIFKPSKK